MATTKLAFRTCVDSLVCHDGRGLLDGVAESWWGRAPISVCCAAGPQPCLDSSVLQEAPANLRFGRHHR